MLKQLIKNWLTKSTALPVMIAVLSQPLVAADYTIDETHSFVQFKIQHLGYSWLYGRFNSIEGDFSYDAARPGSSKINVNIETASIDTNHAERDKHLRDADFLNVKKFPKASFKTTGYKGSADKGVMTGDLTLYGTTKSVSIEVYKVGEGEDPWGGYRAGFMGTLTLTPNEFGMDYDLGPASTTLQLELGIEGIRD